jgi:ATP-dependent DNA helicase RecQ
MIRLLFVTVAFGIGIDVQNIGRVIHIGVPHTMEEFFQEAGQCGRDGLPASSTVYYNNHDISSSRKVCQEMIDYVLSDDVCKRNNILSHFGHSVPKSNMPAHLCCNIHAKTCDCDKSCNIRNARKCVLC